jgi:protein tyrosine phosphatase (PTP) superfamily phosphohydrolase (DUF442 family)
VVNLREPSELRFNDEEKICYDNGVKYINVPVPMQSDEWSIKLADDVLRSMEDAPKPIYIHCKCASRAKTFALLYDTTHSNDPFEEMAKDIGLKEKMPKMVDFAERYLYNKLVEN